MSKGKPPATEQHSGPGANHTIHRILAQFREEVTSNRELGDRFERLICRYLELDPMVVERFSSVWMWNVFPRKGAIGDVGVDVVAEERATGEPSGARKTAKGSPQGERGGVHQFCAIQCKLYLLERTLSKGTLDSYFTALGNPLFTSGMIVSTTDKRGGNAEHAAGHQTKQVSRPRVQDPDHSPVDWSKFAELCPMDNPAIFGEQLYCPGFGFAVRDGLLSDSKGARPRRG